MTMVMITFMMMMMMMVTTITTTTMMTGDDGNNNNNNNNFHGATAPSGSGLPHKRGFTITLSYTTLGRTPLDE